MTATVQRDEIDEARAKVLEAEAAVATTEEAILSGAKGVGAADLLAAERTAEDARNVLAAALDLRGRRDAREAEAARVARLAEMRDLIRERFGAHEGGIVEAFDAAVAALGTLATKVDEHNAGLHEVTEELRSLRPDPGDLGVLASGVGDMVRLPELDVQVAPVDAARLLVEAAWRALAPVDTDAAGAVSALAQIGYDAHAAAHLGLPADSRTPIGLSDELRRTASIVAGR